MENDRYTELIVGVNGAIEGIENGNIIVATAANASTSDFAPSSTIAKYASADTSKGTIEERLSAVGF